jgi:hypothetical protein
MNEESDLFFTIGDILFNEKGQAVCLFYVFNEVVEFYFQMDE